VAPTTLQYLHLIHKEIKSRFISGIVCYHSDQNLLSYRVLSENVNINIFKTVILPLVLYGCEKFGLSH
jgi:hypothetical protein